MQVADITRFGGMSSTRHLTNFATRYRKAMSA